jgi:excisionase family DNA binding protein
MKYVSPGAGRSLMTVTELAEYLKVHPSTIYRLVKTGKLPSLRVGADWRFDPEQINRWFAELEQNRK